MWLQAAFSHADLVLFAEKLFPVHLALEEGNKEGRHIYLGRPKSMELVAGKGLRVDMRARVLWPLLGIDVPIDVPNVTAMMTLEMARLDGEDVFSLSPVIEALDVTHLPGFVESALMGAINAAIAKEHAALTWRFTHTLDFRLPIPEAEEPARRLHVSARWGDVVVTADGITLIAALDADLNARGAPNADDPTLGWAPAKSLDA